MKEFMCISPMNSILCMIMTISFSQNVLSCQNSENDCEKKLHKEQQKLDNAIISIEGGDLKGLSMLLDIAFGTGNDHCVFAELSETAGNMLVESLIIRPKLWIRAFAQNDGDKINRFINSGGMASINDDDYRSEKDSLIVWLKGYNRNVKERYLCQLILGAIE